MKKENNLKLRWSCKHGKRMGYDPIIPIPLKIVFNPAKYLDCDCENEDCPDALKGETKRINNPNKQWTIKT